MKNGLLVGAAVLCATITMALAQTTPPGGRPGAGTGEAPRGQSQPGQEKGKELPGALGKGGEGQKKAQEKSKDQQGQQKAREQPALGKDGAGQKKAQEKGKDQQGGQQQGQQKGKEQPSESGKQGTGQQKGKEGSQAGKTAEPGNVTPQQRTRIQKTVIAKGPKVKNVDFSVNVGTVIPRSVKIVVVPAVLLTVYPEYRGRRYFVYNDQIIIVDDDYKIIAVITL